MYRSVLFRAAVRYAITTCDRFYILSAKHGLLEPDQVIEPYELALNSLSPAKRKHWGIRVGRQLDRAIPWPAEADATIVFLAGDAYQSAIELPDDRDLYWEEPLQGLGIGERIAWLKRHARFESRAA